MSVLVCHSDVEYRGCVMSIAQLKAVKQEGGGDSGDDPDGDFAYDKGTRDVILFFAIKLRVINRILRKEKSNNSLFL